MYPNKANSQTQVRLLGFSITKVITSISTSHWYCCVHYVYYFKGRKSLT